jgi:glutamyl-tRNA reductase
MPIISIGLSHHSSAVVLRERFAFSEDQIPEALERILEINGIQEAMILSTCNRVEVYAFTEDSVEDGIRNLKDFLYSFHGVERPETDEVYDFSEAESIEHLFKVASGLESMVLGETEILGQVKAAYKLALRHRSTRVNLNKAFQNSFNVAKHIRTHTKIQRGSTSVSSVAVELAEKIFTSLSDCQVLVIGAGDTGEKTARALLSRGVKKINVTNRTYAKALSLAEALDGQAIPFDAWEEMFTNMDIVISSTSAQRYVLERPQLESYMKNRRQRSVLLVDIAVPRDIDPQVNTLDNVYLYNIDDLQAISAEYLEQRRDEIHKCEDYIRRKAQELQSTLLRAREYKQD